MPLPAPRYIAATVLLAGTLSAADAAHAFRCGTKLVREEMHELQVIAACGEPTSKRHLGFALRAYDYRDFRGRTGIRLPYSRHLVQEVVVTEFVYNFGPRKLMRRLRFEGGILVDIDSIGYGYLED